jgi:hypothetical protein
MQHHASGSASEQSIYVSSRARQIMCTHIADTGQKSHPTVGKTSHTTL